MCNAGKVVGATAGQRRFRASGMRGEASGDPGAPPGPPGLPSLPPLTSLFPTTNHPLPHSQQQPQVFLLRLSNPLKEGIGAPG